MGDYTRLTFWADLAKDSPAVPTIKQLLAGDPDAGDLPDHPFFRLRRAWLLLTCDSYDHRTGRTQFVYDDIAHAWWLNVDSSLKNYSDEIDQFLDWISPYDTGYDDFRGFYLTNQDDQPTLIHRRNGKYHFTDTPEVPERAIVVYNSERQLGQSGVDALAGAERLNAAIRSATSPRALDTAEDHP